MSTFTQYLTESTKSYDYKIKIAGEPKDIDKNALETALQKFDLAKMSAGKSTPIQSVPLDFPQLKNETVTIFDVTTNYPASVREMKDYLSVYLNINNSMIQVRKPGEPSEEYQNQMELEKTSEYRTKLLDLEYSEHAKVDPADFHSSKANMSLLKELLKDKKDNKDQPKEKENATPKEDQPSESPLTKATNPHPDPKRK
tara:strand:+ start:25 stop:621 length:597 start_codon:yes stop_codon:yes gene_type:complete